MQTAPQARSVPRGIPADRPTVLFVDDEERILRSLRMMFAAHYNVRTTTSGFDALDILRSEPVHALVSDQRMPVMPGVELLRQARDVAPNTMRMLLTGYSDMDAVVGSINEGEVFRFITKPWNPEEMKATVATAVQIAQQLQDFRPRTAAIQEQKPFETILVVDEDPDVAVQIRAVIEEESSHRIAVEWATTVDEVFRILDEKDIALVISDVTLQGEDVTEIVRSLKTHQPHIVTMALTAYRDSGMLASLINHAQIHRFMLKPIRPKFLWRHIQSCLEHHWALKKTPNLMMKHRVATPPPQPQHSPARRILSLFRSLGNRLN